MQRFPLNRIADHCCGNRARIIPRQSTGDTLLAGAQRIVVEVLKLGDGEILAEYRIEGAITQADAAALLATFASAKGGDA